MTEPVCIRDTGCRVPGCTDDQPCVRDREAVVAPVELLTEEEHRAVELLGQVWDLLAGRIVQGGGPAKHDLAEIGSLVHALQNTVLAQAAARAYPDRYRLLGKSLRRQPASDSVPVPSPSRHGIVVHPAEPPTRVVVVPVPHEPWLRR